MVGPNDVFYEISVFLERVGTTWEEASKQLARNDCRALMVQVRRVREHEDFNPGWPKLFNLVVGLGGRVCGCQNLQEFCELLGDEVRAQHLSSRKIADNCSICHSTVWRVLESKVVPSTKTICDMCSALGIRLDFETSRSP